MAALRFGTDGVRGRAFDELSLADAFRIGRAAADVLSGDRAIIGRDTRESGPAFVDALAAGLASGSVEAVDLGVAPTPAVAYLAGIHGYVGIVVSASHNPWFDNGIKLFSSAGTKLSDDEQAAIESRLAELHGGDPADGADGSTAPALRSFQHELGRWVRAMAASIDVDLGGVHVVLDAANGAGSHLIAPALADLGASVSVLFNEPDGRNINAGCGSTHPEALAAAVVERGADVGLALDGDADRLLAVDHRGSVVNGDHLMAMLALDMQRRGVLAGNRLVVTVMTNLGLLKAMEAAGIAVEVTPVGDRAVLHALDRTTATFGGEQSGHFIFTDHATTGDGFLSGLQVLSLLKRSGATLAELADAAMTDYPQILRNVEMHDGRLDVVERMGPDIERATSRLGDQGRVLVRPSGTEPLVRVMVEAVDADLAASVCDQLCDAVLVAAAGAQR